jgi:hypothetical protein
VPAPANGSRTVAPTGDPSRMQRSARTAGIIALAWQVPVIAALVLLDDALKASRSQCCLAG